MLYDNNNFPHLFQRSVPTSSNPVLSHSFMFIGRVLSVIISDAIRKKHFCFFEKNMFFSLKKLGLKKKKHSKSVFFFLNTHLKEITS